MIALSARGLFLLEVRKRHEYSLTIPIVVLHYKLGFYPLIDVLHTSRIAADQVAEEKGEKGKKRELPFQRIPVQERVA